MMKADILKVIEQDLPNQVGIQLKLRLEQADKDAQTVDNLREINKKYLKQLDIIQDQLNKAEHQLAKHKDSTVRELELDKQERDLKVTEFIIKLKCEKDKSQFAKNVALGLVRNTEYRKDVFDSHSTVGPKVENSKAE